MLPFSISMVSLSKSERLKETKDETISYKKDMI